MFLKMFQFLKIKTLVVWVRFGPAAFNQIIKTDVLPSTYILYNNELRLKFMRYGQLWYSLLAKISLFLELRHYLVQNLTARRDDSGAFEWESAVAFEPRV